MHSTLYGHFRELRIFGWFPPQELFVGEDVDLRLELGSDVDQD